MRIVIRGQVHNPTTDDLSGLTVEAWDKDWSSTDDLLGMASTGDDGDFIIRPTGQWKDENDEKLPKVFFRVFASETQYLECNHKGAWEPSPDNTGMIYTASILISPVSKTPADRTDEILNRVGDISHTLGTFITYAPTAYEKSTSKGGRTSEIESVVDNAMRDILGKRIHAKDGKSLLSALDRVIEFEMVEGSRVSKWVAPSYAVETELGAQLTGAPASLYEYARITVTELRRRVNILKPQGTHFDPDRVDGARISFLAELDNLLSFLGKESMRPIIIDAALDRLDDYLNEINLAYSFNNPAHLITVNDHREHTDFEIAKQYLSGLKVAWNNFKNDRSIGYGSKLMALQRLLSVVVVGVEEIDDALEALNFDAGDRRELMVNGNTISLAELMDWVLSFAGNKGVQILKDGTQNAWAKLQSEAEQLTGIMNTVAANPPTRSVLSHPRVNTAVVELATNLEKVADVLATK